MQLPESVMVTLEAGGTVVASSARAARHLRRLYAQGQRGRGLKAWPAPEIVDWETWLGRFWQLRLRQGTENRLLLTPLQEERIWLGVIKQSVAGKRLISVQGIAKLAQDAHQLLSEYEAIALLEGEPSFYGPDVETFKGWLSSFKADCRDQGWLSRSSLPAALCENLVLQPDEAPKRLLLIGLDRITPAQSRLLVYFEAQGCIVEWPVESSRPSASMKSVAALDAKEEISTCAWWIKQKLSRNPLAQIGVIVPDISHTRSEIERIFSQILAPEAVAIGRGETALPFEFSLGLPLAAAPVVRAALLLLRWMDQPLEQEELTWLLLSGFLARDDSDFLLEALADEAMRREGLLSPQHDIDAYLRRRQLSPGVVTLRNARRLWRDQAETKLLFDQWVERAQAILTAANWSGAHRLESEEFQIQARWSQLLDSVSLLSFDGRTVDYGEFREVLEQQAHQTIFSPESRGAPVQILGPSESAGIEFDALWFLGADDAGWPSPSRPHPFIPRELQKRLGLPHADSNIDWQMAKRVTERLQRSSSESIFSYAMQGSDGARRSSMALDQDMPLVPAGQMRSELGGVERKHEQELLRWEEETTDVIPWPVEQKAGGYSVLKMQAACPFQAFATFRLGARDMRRSDWGLDAATRGNVAHRILQDLWMELKDRDGLRAAQREGHLREIISDNVERGLSRYQRRSLAAGEERWGTAYLEAEGERISNLIEEWLLYEADRMPFVVEQCEQSLEASVGDLKLKLRVDRIDAVEGGRLLIDYKTGEVSTDAWLGDRPDDPQLPLYAAFGNVEELRGVLLANIRAGESEFKGQVEDADATLMPGGRFAKQPYNQETRAEWARVLQALGDQFLRGEARVDPKKPSDTCTFCPLHGFCRVAEVRTENAESGDLSD